MKILLLILPFCFLISSCNNSPKGEKLYIKTTSFADKTEVISEVNSDYLEVSFCSHANGTFYSAQRELDKSNSNYKYFYISQKDGTMLQFKESTEFLNFMSAHGYEMIDQLKRPYCTDYTFKKK